MLFFFFQSLGERWAAVCRWTEERWHKLQEVFLVWQQLVSDQVEHNFYFALFPNISAPHIPIKKKKTMGKLVDSSTISAFTSAEFIQSMVGRKRRGLE